MTTIRASVVPSEWGSPPIRLDIAGTGAPGTAAHLLAAALHHELRTFGRIEIDDGAVMVTVQGPHQRVVEARMFCDRFNADPAEHIATLDTLLHTLRSSPT